MPPWLAVAVAAVSPGIHGMEIERARMSEAPAYARVVFDTSEPAAYDLQVLENPHRVVIDFRNATLGAGFDPDIAGTGRRLVGGVRTAPRGDGQRVVLDLKMPARPAVSVLAPIEPYGDRLVVDLYDIAEHPGPRPAVVEPTGKRDVVVAIDAGHGGEDPGAIGPGRVKEKDIVLSISRELARLLDAEPGYRAHLVRDGDYYLSHRTRSETGRRARADMFVSVHADAFKRPEAAGASVWVLSEKGATSETGAWLAQGANLSDLIGGEGYVSLGDREDGVSRVLYDISMDNNRARSLEMGSAILRELGKTTKLHKSRVELAAFMVLRVPDVPSVLVETGFISNPAEARRLGQRDYQQSISRAIFRGVLDFVGSQPPPGTLVAWERGHGRAHGDVRYVITQGDTLSTIASRYGVSTERIKTVNGLATDRIRAGQEIVIPPG